MRLANSGEVFGHFIIPVTQEDVARRALAAAVDRRTRDRATAPAKLTSIAGECDLLLHLFLRDFRLVADLQADVVDSSSLATSWIYAVPYEEAETTGPLDGAGLEFFIYLRVHRHYYARFGAAGEAEILKKIGELLGRYSPERLSLRVLYSLGWPDLIVHGFVYEDIRHLRELVVALQSFSFPTVHRHAELSPLFLRTITLLGTPISLNGRRSGAPLRRVKIKLPVPMLLGRSQPGHTLEAINSLHRLFGKAKVSAKAWALDGTWDLLMTPMEGQQVLLSRLYGALRRSRRELPGGGVERTQAHLLVSDETTLSGMSFEKTPVFPLIDVPALPEECACSEEDFDDLQRRVDEAQKVCQLPRALVQTIRHVLEMFRHTLRDSSNCCDSVGALRAHAQGLELLLDMALRERRFLDATSKDEVELQSSIASEVSYVTDHLVEWCKRAGRVVREKNAGSSARLFLQVDSIVAQRGAIPKILMIAERIMRIFYEGLPPELFGPRRRPPAREFAAVLEPLGNLQSQPLMGLVAIPVRYTFALHLIVPQLWHEVGQHVFAAHYSPKRRTAVDHAITQERTAGKTVFALKHEALLIDFHLRADMFSDLLVFYFGFGGQLDEFCLYLSSLTANVAKHDNLHASQWEKQAVALITRLHFVAQFLRINERVQRSESKTRGEVARLIKKEHKALIGNTLDTQRAIRHVIAVVIDASKALGWPKRFQIPPSLVWTVMENLRSHVYASCLRDMAYVIRTLSRIRLAKRPLALDPRIWRAIEAGELIELRSDEELESAYRELYLEELRAQLAGEGAPPRPGNFRKMATLGRIALLHIYRTEVAAR